MYFATTTVSTTLEVAGSIAGVIFTLGLLFAGVGYFLQSYKGGKDQKVNEETTRQSKLDKTLQDLVDAQEKRYLQLEIDHKENLRQIGVLQGKLEKMDEQQKWFENIFITALKDYFEENPSLAADMNSKLLRGRK